MKNLYFATVLGFQAARMISSISLGRPNSAKDYPVDEVGDLPVGPALLGTSTVLPKSGNGF